MKIKLPDYMIPSAFITMDALPMTPNGKIDQRALPAFDPAEPQTPHDYVAPRNELEETLIDIWSEVLMKKPIGVFDNFFELGGHSLLVAQVLARVRKYLGVDVPVRTVFDEPTVAALAAAVEKTRASGAIPSAPIGIKRSARQTREQLETQLWQLSDEEIDALLTTALARRGSGGAVRQLKQSVNMRL